jgi:hypothetical protein
MRKKKRCVRCKKKKFLDEFYKNLSRRDGRQSHCAECHRTYMKKYSKIAYARDKQDPVRHAQIIAKRTAWRKRNPERARRNARRWRIKQQYGLTMEAYEKLINKTHCEICRQPFSTSRTSSRRRRCVDHCHTSNKIRGVICSGCNVGLAHFVDSSSLLRAAAAYLERCN